MDNYSNYIALGLYGNEPEFEVEELELTGENLENIDQEEFDKFLSEEEIEEKLVEQFLLGKFDKEENE